MRKAPLVAALLCAGDSAGVARKTTSPKEATDFIRFLAWAEAAARWKEAGIEPAH
jgi:ABC-type molybdate transport system substrate-binding protein